MTIQQASSTITTTTTQKNHHIISASQKPSIIRQAEETRDWASPDVVVAAAADDTARMHTGNRLEGFKPYRPTSTLARMVHAARSAYAHNSLAYIHSHTHTQPSVCRMFQAMCMAKSAAAASAAFATVPFPRVSPLAFCFQANLNFVFTAKKTTPTKHTAYVQKTLTGFLATRHQGCVLLKWYFDRQCNTYFTKQIFI